MSLKAFHIVFITLSTLLTLGFGFWGVEDWRRSGNSWHLGLGIGSFGAAVVLVVYGRWFLRKLRRVGYLAVLAASAMLTATPEAQACAVCAGDPSDPGIQGIKAGVFVLLGFIVAVQLGIVAMVAFWMRRARRAALLPPG